MQNNKINKKIILVILVLALIILAGLVIGFVITDNGKQFVQDIQGKLENKEEPKQKRKINENKPWVYNADYLNGREDKKKDERYQFSRDVTVPFININSDDAKVANEEIARLYEELYNEYASDGLTYNYQTKQDERNGESYIITEASYEYYENDNILSVVITYGKFAVPGDGYRDFITYNFNLNTLKFATLDDVCKVCKFKSQSDIMEKIRITAENIASIPETGFDANAQWDYKTFYINRGKVLNVRLPGPVKYEMIEIYNDVVKTKQ